MPPTTTIIELAGAPSGWGAHVRADVASPDASGPVEAILADASPRPGGVGGRMTGGAFRALLALGLPDDLRRLQVDVRVLPVGLAPDDAAAAILAVMRAGADALADPHPTPAQLDAARGLGRQAGEAAGGWAADGNTTADHARRVLADMRDGGGMDWLPGPPTAPRDVADQLGAARVLADDLAAAWDDAADAAYWPEAERVLLAVLPDPGPAPGDPCRQCGVEHHAHPLASCPGDFGPDR